MAYDYSQWMVQNPEDDADPYKTGEFKQYLSGLTKAMQSDGTIAYIDPATNNPVFVGQASPLEYGLPNGMALPEKSAGEWQGYQNPNLFPTLQQAGIPTNLLNDNGNPLVPYEDYQNNSAVKNAISYSPDNVILNSPEIIQNRLKTIASVGAGGQSGFDSFMETAGDYFASPAFGLTLLGAGVGGFGFGGETAAGNLGALGELDAGLMNAYATGGGLQGAAGALAGSSGALSAIPEAAGSLVSGAAPAAATNTTVLGSVAGTMGAPANVVAALNNPIVNSAVKMALKSAVTGSPINMEGVLIGALGNVAGGAVGGITADAGPAISKLASSLTNYATVAAAKGQDVNLEDFAAKYAVGAISGEVKNAAKNSLTDTIPASELSPPVDATAEVPARPLQPGEQIDTQAMTDAGFLAPTPEQQGVLSNTADPNLLTDQIGMTAPEQTNISVEYPVVTPETGNIAEPETPYVPSAAPVLAENPAQGALSTPETPQAALSAPNPALQTPPSGSLEDQPAEIATNPPQNVVNPSQTTGATAQGGNMSIYDDILSNYGIDNSVVDYGQSVANMNNGVGFDYSTGGANFQDANGLGGDPAPFTGSTDPVRTDAGGAGVDTSLSDNGLGGDPELTTGTTTPVRTDSTGSVISGSGGGTSITPSNMAVLRKIFDGTATAADYGQIGSAALPGLLDSYMKYNQTNALKDLADKQMGFGAPSRARYEAANTAGFDPMSIPGYAGALDSTSQAVMRKLSTQGNPYGNPGGLIEANKAIVSGTALPAINSYINQQSNAGGLGALASAAPMTSTAAINNQAGIGTGIGDAIRSVSSDNTNMDQILAKIAKKAYGLGDNGAIAP